MKTTQQTKLRELTQIALFGSVGFVFYLLTAVIVDSLLPLLGCLIRPIIYLTLISSRFHFRKRELIYISLIAAFLYAMAVPCFVNYASVPVSLIFVSISTIGRSKMNPFLMTLAASFSAFVALAILSYFFSPKKSDFMTILKAFPIVIVTGLIVGMIRWKYGKVSCVGCDLCDRPEMMSFSSRIKTESKKG
jgi:hypothetical protein